MPQSILTIEKAMRTIRIAYGVIWYTIFLCIRVGEKLSHRKPVDLRLMWVGLLVAGLMEVGVAFFFRARVLQPAVEILQTKSDDQIALARWRIGNLVSFVLAQSVVLFGFALRFMGGTTWQSLPFYIVGIALMLVWWPRRP